MSCGYARAARPVGRGSWGPFSPRGHPAPPSPFVLTAPRLAPPSGQHTGRPASCKAWTRRAACIYLSAVYACLPRPRQAAAVCSQQLIPSDPSAAPTGPPTGSCGSAALSRQPGRAAHCLRNHKGHRGLSYRRPGKTEARLPPARLELMTAPAARTLLRGAVRKDACVRLALVVDCIQLLLHGG